MLRPGALGNSRWAAARNRDFFNPGAVMYPWQN